MNASLLDRILSNGNMLDSRPVFTKAMKKKETLQILDKAASRCL